MLCNQIYTAKWKSRHMSVQFKNSCLILTLRIVVVCVLRRLKYTLWSKMQLIYRLLRKLPSNNVLKVNRTQIRNVSRLLKKEHVTVLNEETLTGRMLLYLNNDSKKPKLNIVPAKNAERLLKDIKQNANSRFTINIDELFYLLNTVLPKQKVLRNKNELLNNLDLEFCLRISEMDVKHVLYLLKSLVDIVPNRINECKSYHRSIRLLYDSINVLDKNDLLQFMFYVSLQKKHSNSQEMLRVCLRKMDINFIKKLSVEDLCIICNSTFRTSTKIVNKELLNKITMCLNDNLFLLKDAALYVTLLKTIRHNRAQNDDLLSTISCGMFFNRSHELYAFGDICHILAVYADYFYYDQQVFDVFTGKCLEELKNNSFKCKHDHISVNIRGKDIKRFVWVMSMFSELKLISQAEIDSILIPKLIERIVGGEFDKDVASLVDIALYFWIMNYRPYNLVPYIFTKKNMRQLDVKNGRTQLRLNLLLYAIYVEDRNLYKTLGVSYTEEMRYSAQYQVKNRPLLQRILSNLEKIAPKLNMEGFDITQEVPFANILGITGYKNGENKAVYIELLDDYSRIKNVDEDLPVGLMALKLRLLDKNPEALLMVNQKEVDEMTDAELKDFLFDEIKLIC